MMSCRKRRTLFCQPIRVTTSIRPFLVTVGSAAVINLPVFEDCYPRVYSTVLLLTLSVYSLCGLGSSVGKATDYGAGRSGIESRWGRDFPPVQTGPAAHQASCKMGTGSFSGVKYGRGVLLNTHPLLVPRSW